MCLDTHHPDCFSGFDVKHGSTSRHHGAVSLQPGHEPRNAAQTRITNNQLIQEGNGRILATFHQRWHEIAPIVSLWIRPFLQPSPMENYMEITMVFLSWCGIGNNCIPIICRDVLMIIIDECGVFRSFRCIYGNDFDEFLHWNIQENVSEISVLNWIYYHRKYWLECIDLGQFIINRYVTVILLNNLLRFMCFFRWYFYVDCSLYFCVQCLRAHVCIITLIIFVYFLLYLV